jgi:uncharacterized membrane protein YbhN (UPF0104 family)
MLVSVVFLAKTIWDYKSKINLSLIKHPYAAIGFMLVTVLGFAAVVYISSFAWKQILQFLYGKKIVYGEIREVYVKSNVGKYIPGNFMHFAGRNMLGKKLGFSHFDMALSTVTEMLTLVITACFWALVLDFQSFTQAVTHSFKVVNHILLIAIFVAAIAAVAAVVIFAAKKGYIQKLRKLFTKGFFKLFSMLFGIYSFTLIVPGIFLVMIYTQVFGTSPSIHTVLLTIAAYIISWVLGYIVPGAPGGLGVREAAFTLILGTSPITVVAIILHRIASILGDALAFLIEVCLSHKTLKG